MSRLRIKPKRECKPKGMLTLMEAVRVVMKHSRCSEDEAKRFVQRQLESGELPFTAVVERDGEKVAGKFRVLGGKFSREQ
jgi:hypothetical protein